MYMRPTTCAVLEIQYNDGDEKKHSFTLTSYYDNLIWLRKD